MGKKVLRKMYDGGGALLGASKLTVDHGVGCVDAKWWDGALCGACAMEVEFVVKMIAVVRAACC